MKTHLCHIIFITKPYNKLEVCWGSSNLDVLTLKKETIIRWGSPEMPQPACWSDNGQIRSAETPQQQEIKPNNSVLFGMSQTNGNVFLNVFFRHAFSILLSNPDAGRDIGWAHCLGLTPLSGPAGISSSFRLACWGMCSFAFYSSKHFISNTSLVHFVLSLKSVPPRPNCCHVGSVDKL